MNHILSKKYSTFAVCCLQHGRAQQDASMATWWGAVTHGPEMQAVLAPANFDTSDEMGPGDQVRSVCRQGVLHKVITTIICLCYLFVFGLK